MDVERRSEQDVDAIGFGAKAERVGCLAGILADRTNAGTNEDEALKILGDAGFSAYTSMDEVVEKAVEHV